MQIKIVAKCLACLTKLKGVWRGVCLNIDSGMAWCPVKDKTQKTNYLYVFVAALFPCRVTIFPVCSSRTRVAPCSLTHTADAMEHVRDVVDPIKEFVVESRRLVRRCTKPDRSGV